MAKLTLTDITAAFASITTLNANNALIEAALENTLSRDGTSPNAMAADLDMDSNSILNLPQATTATEPVRLGDIAAEIAAAGVNHQGAWVTATAYVENDIVTNGGGSYIATADHTSGASTEPGVGGSFATVWDILAEKGDTGATGAAGADGVFSGGEATVTPENADKIALFDASDSDNPKVALFSSFSSGGVTAPTRTSQALSGSSVDISIPAGCTRLVFASVGTITMSTSAASCQARLVSSSTEDTFTGITEVGGSASAASSVLAFCIAGSVSGTSRTIWGTVDAVRQARVSPCYGKGLDGTNATERNTISDTAADFDTLRIVASTGTFSAGTVEVEFYYQ